MIQATPRDYWISPSALFFSLNSMGNPDFIQASCVSGAQIMVFVQGVIGYDAGHNYRRWTLQASPTVFNTHTQKYVYVAIPRNSLTNTAAASRATALVVYPSELIDIYGQNEAGEQIGSEEFYYIFLQGILSSSGDNGTVYRDWYLDDEKVLHNIDTGYLASHEANAAQSTSSDWYKYSSVDELVTFLKNLTMAAGTKFFRLFAQALQIVKNGSISFEGQTAELRRISTGEEDDTSAISDTDAIVTPNAVDRYALSRRHDDKMDGSLELQNILAHGKADVFGNLSVGGIASVAGDLSVTGDASFSSSASVTKTLSAGSAALAPAIVDGAVVPTTTVDADGIKTRKEAKMRTVVFGDYLPGLITGAAQGAKITESGDASFRSVSISGYLEVPEIRFNRATVQLGIGIRSVGGGIIEEVIPDTDADGNPLMSGRAALKLEDGEIGAIEVGDKCLGFWHNITGNSTADRDDRNGDYELRGFSSVYFRIDAIFATEQAYRDYDTAASDDGCISKYFHYVLRGSNGTDGWNQRHHPSPNMHFGMIANNIYTDRQDLKIETTRYDLSLTRMTEWNYTHSNIMEVGGLLDGFSMQAERYNEVTGEYETYIKEFKGHGRVLGQCYIFGQIDKFERQGYYCTVFQSKNGFIMPNETEMETVKVYTGYGEEVTEKFPYIKVTRDSGDSASDAVWNAEHTSVDNPFPITFADLRIDAIERISTEFHVYASDGVNQTRTSTITFE